VTIEETYYCRDARRIFN